MKILYSWLMDFVGAELEAEDAIRKLQKIGFKVEEAKKTGASFKGVVTGRILKIDRHPNADRLSLVEVDTGKNVFKVVCGAGNIAVGQKVPFAAEGAVLTTGMLKKAKIRGVESAGMICSGQELGVEEKSDGIMTLPEDTPLGIDALDLFPKQDWLMEFEILPNQAYCLSHMALAREICSFYGLPFKKPSPAFPDGACADFPINIEKPMSCPRYTGIALRNLRFAPTPQWMVDRLRFMGINPKNNILIDVSNYVLFELGQPTHCFDLDLLKGPAINVRSAGKGERIKTLDGEDLELSEKFLVIADTERPVALAGVIGGVETAVSESTKNILIESAYFNPLNIRKTSKETGIKTESSYRFERGTDPEITAAAGLRIVELIKQSVPQARIEAVIDNYPLKYRPAVIEVEPMKIKTILGADISDNDMLKSLRAVDLQEEPSEPWKLTVPSFRHDIENIWDVAEETGRFIGYDVIPAETGMKLMRVSPEPFFEISLKLKTELAGCGFSEVYNYDFVSNKDLKNCMLDEKTCIDVLNPVSSDYRYMRPSLMSGLLKALRYNLNRGQESVFIFEIGKIYLKENGSYSEEAFCAGVAHGVFPAEHFWRQGLNEEADFYHVKGIVMRIFETVGDLKFASGGNGFFAPEFCAEIADENSRIGRLGKIKDSIVSANDIKAKDVWYFEIPLKALIKDSHPGLSAGGGKVKPVSVFPRIWRDLSVVVGMEHKWLDVQKAVQGVHPVRNPPCPKGTAAAPPMAGLISNGAYLEKAELIDLYRGKNIPEGMKSLTIRLTFSSMERTLTDAEVDGYISNILDKLAGKFSARLRT
ncbi:MAG: phenylalanine--tRNA ligase subunit beta [Elusimicrobia bacterium]|nr:phenylalanine--tRNA ligase subunit beta [Elusimicrobiota bacterium]